MLIVKGGWNARAWVVEQWRLPRETLSTTPTTVLCGDMSKQKWAQYTLALKHRPTTRNTTTDQLTVGRPPLLSLEESNASPAPYSLSAFGGSCLYDHTPWHIAQLASLSSSPSGRALSV